MIFPQSHFVFFLIPLVTRERKTVVVLFMGDGRVEEEILEEGDAFPLIKLPVEGLFQGDTRENEKPHRKH